MTAVRIGDFALSGFGAETFSETGMEIKKGSPSVFTMFASMTDGCIGYLPTAAAHDEGGYEVDDAPFFYRYPARLKKECESIALEAGLETLGKAFAQ